MRYDKAYFDRWYRDPATRVKSAAGIARKASLALAVAEYYLERSVKTVLDIGCGEGNWLSPLKKLRPSIRYTGIDSSPYVVDRYGKSRGICLGSFASLDRCGLREAYDLIICSDMLFYLSPSELREGLSSMAPLVGGIAFLELYTDQDEVIGDFPNTGLFPAAHYKKLLRENGLVSIGSHCYLGPELASHAMEMEHGG